MVLVDTSIWIDHFHSGEAAMAELLTAGRIVMHPFVAGELACGSLHNRTEILRLLRQLPKVPVATDDEVLFFIEQHGLMGKGIGYIDAHLLSATILSGFSLLWTRDKRLNRAAEMLGIAYRKV